MLFTQKSVRYLEIYQTTQNTGSCLKNLICPEGDQLLGADFHAVLGKVVVNMLQLQRRGPENGSFTIKDTFKKGCCFKWQFCMKVFERLVLNFRHVWAKFKDVVPHVSDSNRNNGTSCKPKIKLSDIKGLYINEFLLPIPNGFTVDAEEYY